MLSGFINLYKNKDITSNKALSILKYHLKKNNISTKVGHFGTLDPDAEGVLPVALGRATRLFDYFIDKKKIYYSIFRFGISTDTLDASGEIVSECNKIILSSQIKELLPLFEGELEQVPPKYSAKSINGKRAYDLARKGIEFELKPKTVTIYSIELLEERGENCFTFRIVCSGGTYIRSIARDLANALGTVGIMQYLKREKSGVFSLEESVTLAQLEIDMEKHILPIEIALDSFERYNISENDKKSLLDGIKMEYKNLPKGFFKVYNDNELLGIGFEDELGRLKIKTWLL